MRSTGIGFLILSVMGIIFQVTKYIQASYYFEKNYSYTWKLAERGSTIEIKRQKLQEFAKLLHESQEFSEYDAVFLKTGANSFVNNLAALDTLVDRLSQIQKMSPISFEYNTAIQQITAQEQGEAQEMLQVFYHCYLLGQYPTVWCWIEATVWMIIFLVTAVGVVLVVVSVDNGHTYGSKIKN